MGRSAILIKGTAMNKRDVQQLELFADGARAVAAAVRSKPLPLIEERLRAKLDSARQRLHEIVILGMKSWLSDETRQGPREAEAFRRAQVRVHHRLLDQFRAGSAVSFRGSTRRDCRSIDR
jgi:hypothetical protein